MRQFQALVSDAWRESRDKRLVQVLLLLCLLLVVFFSSLSFAATPIDGAISHAFANLANFTAHLRFGGRMQMSTEANCHVEGPRAPVLEDDLPVGVDGLRVVEVEFEAVEKLNALCLSWDSFQQRQKSGRWDDSPPERAVVSDADRIRFFEERLAAVGFAPVYVRAVPDAGNRWRVALGVERPLEVRGACKVSFLFGAFGTTLDNVSQAEFLASFESGIAGTFAGFIGILIFISAMAGAVPEMLQKGRLDLLLARPVGRVRLVLFRYLGAVLFVLLTWTLLFTGCTVALGVTTGYWCFTYIGCAVTCTLIFAALYPVSMLVGALSRNVTLATLGALVFWALQGIVQSIKSAIDSGMISNADRWKPLVNASYWILPKSADLGRLNDVMLARSNLSDQAFARAMSGPLAPVDWWFAGGTTALFAAGIMALTCMHVARRDY